MSSQPENNFIVGCRRRCVSSIYWSVSILIRVIIRIWDRIVSSATIITPITPSIRDRNRATPTINWIIIRLGLLPLAVPILSRSNNYLIISFRRNWQVSRFHNLLIILNLISWNIIHPVEAITNRHIIVKSSLLISRRSLIIRIIIIPLATAFKRVNSIHSINI